MSAQLGHLPDDIAGEISQDLADRIEGFAAVGCLTGSSFVAGSSRLVPQGT